MSNISKSDEQESKMSMKTEWQLAKDHTVWFLDTFSVILKKVCEEFFVHGYKHGYKNGEDSLERG
jgi:hypothetical protein